MTLLFIFFLLTKRLMHLFIHTIATGNGVSLVTCFDRYCSISLYNLEVFLYLSRMSTSSELDAIGVLTLSLTFSIGIFKV